MTPEEVRALSDERGVFVFVSDFDASQYKVNDYLLFLVGAGFSLPGTVVERQYDSIRRGVVFHVSRPHRG